MLFLVRSKKKMTRICHLFRVTFASWANAKVYVVVMTTNFDLEHLTLINYLPFSDLGQKRFKVYKFNRSGLIWGKRHFDLFLIGANIRGIYSQNKFFV